jgi:hypothetical protein
MAKKKTKASIGECVYCGKNGKLTADHVPPQCLFPGIPRNLLVELPACFSCNNGASKDDQWFKGNLAFREDVSGDADYQEITASAIRDLARLQAQGMANHFLRYMHEVEIVTRSGLFLGRKLAFDADLNRLSKVPTRIVKGLFWKIKGYRLPAGYEATTFAASGLKDAPADAQQPLKALLEPILEQTMMRIGQSFNFLVGFSPENPNPSIWITVFFKRVFFLSFTTPQMRGGA